MVQQNDGTLLGVIDFLSEVRGKCKDSRIELQVFANIRYHFKWIAEVTGLEVPRCQRSSRDEMFFHFYRMAQIFNKRLTNGEE